MIILLADGDAITRFGIAIRDEERQLLGRYWPGKISIVFPLASRTDDGVDISEKYRYLHRGSESLCFRVPDDVALRELLRKTGPLVAPSANPSGHPPAMTAVEARTYFGDQVDIYIDSGRVESEPSTVARLDDGRLVVLRQGAVTL